MTGFSATGVTGSAPPQAPKPHSVWNAAGFKKGPAAAFRGHETDESLADGLDGSEDANVLPFQKPQAQTPPAPAAEAYVTPANENAPAPSTAQAAPTPAAVPAHDKEMARRFLAALDPNATEFTFQFFADSGNKYAEIFHGTLDEVWPKVLALKTPRCGAGAYVTINKTDLKGRKATNIEQPRALYADADGEEQTRRCISQLAACGCSPSTIVKSGRGYHFYFFTDVPRDQFSMLQKQLIDKLGTDPAVHDLPRVMRLPGTLHLKDPTNPKPVQLLNKPGAFVQRWQLPDLVSKLGLSPSARAPKNKTAGAKSHNTELIPGLNNGPAAVFAGHGTDESLSDGTKADGWAKALSPELQDQVVDYALGILAAKTKFLEKRDDGGDNDIWYKLTTSVGVSGAPHAENIFIKYASAAKNADSEADLRQHFLRCQADADGRITVGTLLFWALENGADFDQWKREAPPIAPLPPEKRRPLKGGTYSRDEALELINSHYLIGKSDQEIGIFRIRDDGTLTFTPAEHFKLDVANVFVRPSKKGPAKPVEKFWKEDPRRHQRKIVFKPGGAVGPDEFNLWRGFGVEPRNGWRKQRRLLRHIWVVICRRDKKKFKYLMRWLAWAVQNPDKYPGTIIVLKSRKQGTGKSTLGAVMILIFSQHGTLIDDNDRLLGRFNDWIEPISFILAEEILWAGDHKTADKLKSRVTANTIQIDAREVPSVTSQTGCIL